MINGKIPSSSNNKKVTAEDLLYRFTGMFSKIEHFHSLFIKNNASRQVGIITAEEKS